MSMKHYNRRDLHERLIRMYSAELLDPGMDPEVRLQMEKKLEKTLGLKRKLELHLKTIKNREYANS